MKERLTQHIAAVLSDTGLAFLLRVCVTDMDELNLLRGGKHEINDKISINSPTLGEILEYGEDRYWALVSSLTATSYDFRFALDDAGIDYEDVDDFTVFGLAISGLSIEDSRILFGDLHLDNFTPIDEEEDEGIIYKNFEDRVNIDIVIYELIVSYLRKLHGFKRNYKVAGNKAARKFYMEEERRILEEKAKKGEKMDSLLAPLVSSMVNCNDFKYNYETVWQLPLYTFMDSVKRIQKISDYRNLMVGVNTGNIDVSKIPSERFNWLGGL
ncbi:hypothetical protein M2140_000148 [Clostridiales Family XIII bacterium PM5-7]